VDFFYFRPGYNTIRKISELRFSEPVLRAVDWVDKTREIEKFLFNPDEAKKVQMFPLYATEEVITSWLEI
jgi:hypothetical protein